MMSRCSSKLLEELKRRAIFSEYLPENFNVDSEGFDIFLAGGSNKENIEPYQFNMSRFNNSGDRRVISIPEISAYTALIEFFRQNESILDDIIQLSRYDTHSFSRIIDENENIIVDDAFYGTSDLDLRIRNDGDVSRVYEKNRLTFLNNMYKKIEYAQGANGILYLDISDFYGSIYTHSLTAIKIGVENAKNAYQNNNKNEVYRLYAKLDEVVRGLNGKRKNGLLIGPYVSRILSEAVLANLDADLLKEKIEFTRYADDYEIIVRNNEDIDTVKSKVNTVFEKYYFRCNSEKTHYEEYPFYIFNNFEFAVKQISNDSTIDSEKTIELFNRFLKMEKDGDKGAIRYLLRRHKDEYSISDKKLYLAYLLNLLTNDEKALGMVCRIIIEEYKNENIEMNDTIYQIIFKELEAQIKKKHDLEVVWLVYLMKYVDYPMTREVFFILLSQTNELAKIILIYEWEEFINDFWVEKCWKEAKSWILLYSLAVKYSKKQEEFYKRLNIQKSRNFYQKLFKNGFLFYKSTYNKVSTAENETKKGVPPCPKPYSLIFTEPSSMKTEPS